MFNFEPLLLLASEIAPLAWQGWVALLVTSGVFIGLQLKRVIPVEMLFLSGLVIVTLAGVLTPEQALAGFSSTAVLLIGAMFAVTAGLRCTGALDWVSGKLLDSAQTERSALLRLAGAVVPASAFVLNTPLVAMFVPVVVDWCRKRSVSPSRLLIPLSYLTILGGVCTLIGTSTTLVCNATLADNLSQYDPSIAARIGELSFFEISWVGVPVALIGTFYMITIAPRLLPNRNAQADDLGARRREYLVEMHVQPDCPLIGKTVEAAGLRQLPGLFLIEIDRKDQLITPVTPRDIIKANDQLVFTGVVTTIADLERIPGLVPAADVTYEFHPAARTRRQLTEAVLSRTSPLIGQTVRDAGFRQRYNAAIVAVHRNGERLTNKIGNISLEPGDTLLLQTCTDFVDANRHNRDFYLVSKIGESSARRHDKALIAGGLFGLLIVWLSVSSLLGNTLPWGNLFANKPHAIIAITITLVMVLTRCLSSSEARSAIDLQVLLTIAAAIGLGKALHVSGAAKWIADTLVNGVEQIGCTPQWQPYVLLVVVYLLAMLFTETITNVAVAAIMIPVAVSVAIVGGYDPRPFIIGVAMAASLSFMTPIGYQTNLMVMGPGGYIPRDYLRVGTPLACLVSVVSILLIPILWPF